MRWRRATRLPRSWLPSTIGAAPVRGQYIDQSQAESALHFLGPAILDYTVNGRSQDRLGNRDTQMAPHGVYPAAGEDCWVAITVATQDQWETLCDVMQQPDLAVDDRFVTIMDRRTHQDALDERIAAWTRERDASEIEARLQAQGIAAHAVLTMYELYNEPQFAYRRHFVELEHSIHGTTTVEGSRFKLSRTPARVEGPGLTLGRDNHYVLETILGYPPERIRELEAQGILK